MFTFCLLLQGHAFRLLHEWLAEFTDIREALNRDRKLTLKKFVGWIDEIENRIAISGRDYPIPTATAHEEKVRQRQEQKLSAIAEQQRESEALAGLAGLDL